MYFTSVTPMHLFQKMSLISYCILLDTFVQGFKTPVVSLKDFVIKINVDL